MNGAQVANAVAREVRTDPTIEGGLEHLSNTVLQLHEVTAGIVRRLGVPSMLPSLDALPEPSQPGTIRGQLETYRSVLEAVGHALAGVEKRL